MATNYNKWDKFAAELSDSDDERPQGKLIKQISPQEAKSAPTDPHQLVQMDPDRLKNTPKPKTKEEKEEQAAIAAQLQVGKKKYEKRKRVTYQGRTIYEWEQTLEEVDIYITPPPGVKSQQIRCEIEPTHLKVGIKGCPLFMDEKLGGRCVKSESYWMIEDGVLHINLQKAKCGEAWMGATQHKGQQLNEVEKQELKQNILLERFQREHPGFDFSNAKFNGMAPDARKFLGGINSGELNRNVSFK